MSTTVRPDSTISTVGTWTPVGAGTVHGALAVPAHAAFVNITAPLAPPFVPSAQVGLEPLPMDTEELPALRIDGKTAGIPKPVIISIIDKTNGDQVVATGAVVVIGAAWVTYEATDLNILLDPATVDWTNLAAIISNMPFAALSLASLELDGQPTPPTWIQVARAGDSRIAGSVTSPFDGTPEVLTEEELELTGIKTTQVRLVCDPLDYVAWAALIVTLLDDTEVDISAGPGTYGDLEVEFSSYVPGESESLLDPQFQGEEGTGTQGTITVTLSQPIKAVRVTCLDPDFTGNKLEAALVPIWDAVARPAGSWVQA